MLSVLADEIRETEQSHPGQQEGDRLVINGQTWIGTTSLHLLRGVFLAAVPTFLVFSVKREPQVTKSVRAQSGEDRCESLPGLWDSCCPI